MLLLPVFAGNARGEGKGVLAEEIAAGGVPTLNEGWDYFDKQLLTPQDFSGKIRPQRTHSIALRDFKYYRENDLVYGYGTYRKILDVGESGPLLLRLAELRAAAIVWVNGNEVFRGGQPGRSLDEEIPGLDTVTAVVTPHAGKLDIVIQNSNFHLPSRIANEPLRIAKSDPMVRHQRSLIFHDFIVVGAILIMSFYHLVLYYLRRENRAPLWLGFFCFLVSIRTFALGEHMIQYDFFEFPYHEFKFKTEMLGYALGVMAFTRFTRILYPGEIPKWFTKLVVYPSLLYAAIIALTPVRFYMSLLDTYQLVTLLGIGGILIGAVRASMHRRDGAKLFLSGFGLMAVTIILDMLSGSGFINNSISLVHLGLFAFVFIQSVILSRRFAKDYTLLQVAEAENRHLNENLESEVAERTQTIRTIYDNVQSGFFMVDQNLRLLEGFTKSCRDLFAAEVREGVELATLLGLSGREKEHFNLALSQTFDRMMPPEVCLSQIAKRFQLAHSFISLKGAAVLGANGEIKAILFTATNATALAQTEMELELSRALLKISRQKINFQEFLEESRLSIEHGIKQLAAGKKNQVKLILHTLKGNFAAYGLQAVTGYIHELEGRKILKETDLTGIKDRIHEFMETHAHIVGLEDNMGRDAVLISKGELHELAEYFQSHKQGGSELFVEQWINSVRMVPCKRYIESLAESARELAAQLGKSVSVETCGADIKINPELMQSIMLNLIHLVRNAIDHGIEFSDERQTKPTTGRLSIQVTEHSGPLQIIIADDGHGIDEMLLIERALDKKIISQEQAASMSRDDILQLIFAEGLSTRSVVSDISGRGIGMGALREAVSAIGGRIEVASEIGQGATFTITMDQAAAVQQTA